QKGEEAHSDGAIEHSDRQEPIEPAATLTRLAGSFLRICCMSLADGRHPRSHRDGHRDTGDGKSEYSVSPGDADEQQRHERRDGRLSNIACEIVDAQWSARSAPIGA